MRQLPGLLLMLSFGCSAQTPNLKLHVEPAQTAGLAPEVLRQLEEKNAAALREIDRDLEHGRERVAAAGKALDTARAEPITVADIHAAKVARADSELQWAEALVQAAEWRRASTAAAGELATAETLSRTGRDIDVAAYATQHEQMRAGLTAALKQQAARRAEFDESERRLTAAKARYAQGRVVASTEPSLR